MIADSYPLSDHGSITPSYQFHIVCCPCCQLSDCLTWTNFYLIEICYVSCSSNNGCFFLCQMELRKKLTDYIQKEFWSLRDRAMEQHHRSIQYSQCHIKHSIKDDR